MGVLFGKLNCLLFLLQYKGMVIVSWLDKTTCLISEGILRIEFGIQNPLMVINVSNFIRRTSCEGLANVALQ